MITALPLLPLAHRVHQAILATQALPARPTRRMSSSAYRTLPVPGEAVQASARQAVIHLVDIAGITSSTPADYATKNLYLWNNETCDALSAPVADWNDVSTTPTGSDKYGPYWVIPLTKESGCINVIVRDGTNKLIDSDLRVLFQ